MKKFVIASYLLPLLGALFILPTNMQAMQESTNPTAYVFELNYQNSQFTQTSTLAAVPYVFAYDPVNFSGSYRGQIKDITGNLIQEFNYNLQTGPNRIFVPFHANAGEVTLFNGSNQAIYKYSLAEIATCNKNNKCEAEAGETSTSCPNDCQISPNTNGGETPTAPPTQKKTDVALFVFIGAIVISIILAVWLVFYLKKN